MPKPITKIVILILLLIPKLVSAHGFGTTLETTDKDYTIDVDYDNTAFAANLPTEFQLNLYNHKTIEKTPFDDAAIILKDNEKTLFSATVTKNSLDKTSFTYLFPKNNTYTLEITYRNTNGTLAHGQVNIPITNGKNSTTDWLKNNKKNIGLALIISSLLMGVTLIMKKHKKTPTKPKENTTSHD